MPYTRIVFAEHAVETLGFFSRQLAKAFEKMGKKTWFWDMEKPEKSRAEFLTFYRRQETAFLTFNFIGLSEEEQFEWEEYRNIWENFEIPCFCILVDHPMYYFKQLSGHHENVRILCIDRGHGRFVEEFYPKYGSVPFCPLAGTGLSQNSIPYEERDIDVVFAGNYVALPNLLRHLEGVEEENKEFYFKIIEELISHPDLPVDTVILRNLREEFTDITRHETLACMYGMIFIDLYVRSYFRREIVCSLAEAGIKVLVLGKDWELSECKRSENIVTTGQVDSLTCLQYMQRAKISLNIMPWFKEGAHDRVFNSMLQGCVTVTDSSGYLDEALREGTDYIGYRLDERERLQEIIKGILADERRAKAVAKQGYKTALKNHTWEKRAEILAEIEAVGF